MQNTSTAAFACQVISTAELCGARHTKKRFEAYTMRVDAFASLS
jgi:hypothetical protein